MFPIGAALAGSRLFPIDRYSARALKPPDRPVTLRRSPILALLAAALLAASLSGCGRKGPLELPPETQARGAALKAQEEAQARPNKAPPAPGADAPARQEPAIPGTIGHRPPEQYPFPLDPLL